LSRDELAKTHLDRGLEQMAAGALSAARDSFTEARALSPSWADAHFQLAFVNVDLGARDLAEQGARAALDLDPRHAGAAHLLGALFCEQNRLAEALPWLQSAVALSPQTARFQRDLGAIQLFYGDVTAARASLQTAIRLDPHAQTVVYTLAWMTRMGDGSAGSEELFGTLLELAKTLDDLPIAEQIEVWFALGKAHEDRGETDQAFAAFAKANALKRSTFNYDADGAARRLRRTAEIFNQPLIERLGGKGAPGDRPIFIVGMPRSGTTLVEQIISAHPLVHGAGELPVLSNLLENARGAGGSPYPDWVPTMSPGDCKVIGQAYLDRLPAGLPGQVRTTDKWLGNFEHIGLIHLCLPGATIIHCRRDPRDSCFSAFSIRFNTGQEFAYTMEELGRFWRDYDGLMSHWRAVLPPGRMLEVPYEALVGDLDSWARRIVAHCRLDWDEACLRYYESKRPVRSASLVQVREPIYSTSIGRWKPFERHLAPLFDAMGRPWERARAAESSAVGSAQN
jgi:tetratricopeptide (TPR) repeat protein